MSFPFLGLLLEEFHTRRSRRRFFLVILPFEPGGGSAQAGIHALDARLLGNDDGTLDSDPEGRKIFRLSPSFQQGFQLPAFLG